jgi:beta-glucanase (GH16 family)
MELLGQNPRTIYGSYHWENQGTEGNASQGYSLSSGSFSDNFHVFSLQWDSAKMAILVDDVAYSTINKSDVTGSSYPFDKPFFFIFNVAVGGNWPGSPNSSTTFPQRMIVDYVRVFQ